MNEVRFDFYKPISKVQEEFHSSDARHKMLIGGYGGGKTYPAIFEMFKHCFCNPKHEYGVFKNTWDSLSENVEQEIVEIAFESEAAFEKDFEKTKHNLTLRNGLKIMFRPLTMDRQQAKGMCICGFFLDDPDARDHEDMISFLFSRLRDPARIGVRANEFKTIITANYEGHDWLWNRFMSGKEPGTNYDGFCYWLVRTTDNPTLGSHYIKDLETIHTKDWMDRYVYMRNVDHMSGIVYASFDKGIHHFNRDDLLTKDDLIRVIGIDVGHNATVVLQAATDGDAIYIYDEWYQRGITTSQLGEYLIGLTRDTRFQDVIIDPASGRQEQTSGKSIRGDLWDTYGIRTITAENELDYGIEVVKDLLAPAKGKPYLYVDCMHCQNTAREAGSYRYKELPYSNSSEATFSNKPVDKNNDCMDTMRYICMRLRNRLNRRAEIASMLAERRRQMLKDRLENLKMFNEYPELARQETISYFKQTHNVDLSKSRRSVQDMLRYERETLHN